MKNLKQPHRYSGLLFFLWFLEGLLFLAAIFLVFFCDFSSTIFEFISCMIMQRVYIIGLGVMAAIIAIPIGILAGINKNSKRSGG